MGFAVTSLLPAWLCRRTVGGAAEQSSRWQAFRKAALATPYYRHHPIARASVVEQAEFYAHHVEFFNPAAEKPEPVPLSAPWEPPPKALAVLPWFRLLPPVETTLDLAETPGKGVDVLAAPVRVLAALAARRPPLPSPPGYGVVAFTGISHQAIEAADRDLLWAAWRVPVFEQFRGFQGELLAAECEAFEGLHFDPELAVWEERGSESRELVVTSLLNLRHPAWRLATGRGGRVEHAACACGSTLPRIVWDD
jgi:hypothetical protein